MTEQNTEKGGRSFGRILILLSFFILAGVMFVDPAIFPRWVRQALIIFACSVCVVYGLTPLVIMISRKVNAMDYPTERKVHTVPTPRWGGIAVYAGLVISLLVVCNSYMPDLKVLLVSSTFVLAVGLLDDLVGIRASVKLLGQLAACILLIANGVQVTFLPDTWWGIAGEWLITVIWIVGITNAINFLDGMDGLVPGLVAGSSVIYFTLSFLVGSPMLAYVSMSLLGVSFCFLSYNMKPARIFLGDGGSNFLGFFLAAMSIHGTWAAHDPLVSFFIPMLILSVPIYDMVFTTVSRIATGKVTSVRSWLEFTGRDHIHHRLEALGLSRGKVVLTIWVLNMAVGLGAITLMEARTYGGLALVAQTIGVYVIIALLEVLGGQKGRKSGAGS